MSLQAAILSLISEVQDPALRTDIASTIVFLKDLYMTGRVSEEQLRKELYEVVGTVIDALYPMLLPEEKEKKVEEFVAQMVRAIKMETLRARVVRRGIPLLPP